MHSAKRAVLHSFDCDEFRLNYYGIGATVGPRVSQQLDDEAWQLIYGLWCGCAGVWMISARSLTVGGQDLTWCWQMVALPPHCL